jgi:hypothetical protein
VPEAEGGEAGSWRSIDELAALVGAYCWLEQRIFEVTGAWATGSGPEEGHAAELRVWSAAASRRHGDLAGRWAERLPVRAGVDRSALVTPPDAPGGLADALEELAAPKELSTAVFALVETVLPWVGGIYGLHLAVATPVSEASVMEMLVEARRDGSAEIRAGRVLLDGMSGTGSPSRHVAEAVKRAFAQEGITPAVRPG